MSIGAKLIAEERKRQVQKEGWAPEHDDKHCNGGLAWASMYYASPTDLGVWRY